MKCLLHFSKIDNNNMTLHKDKFEYMSYQHNRQNYLLELPFVCEQFQYKVSDTTLLRPVEQLRDLGVTMSSDLSWSQYIYEITGKARQKAIWVLAVFRSRSKDIILTLYKSMVRSQLEYCSPLWNPFKISSIQELESVQKVFTSKISGMTELNYWDRLRQQSLMPLLRRRERYIILHMWKVLHSITSNDLNIDFVHRHQAKVPFRNRSSSAFHLSAYEHSFAVMGPKLWNCIPYVLNTIQDFPPFKRKLTVFLLSVPDMRYTSSSRLHSSQLKFPLMLSKRQGSICFMELSGHTRRLY